MATQKIFGGNLTVGQQAIAALGSTAGGSPQYTLDADDLQNAQWLQGVDNNVWVKTPDPAGITSYSNTQNYLVGQYAKDAITNIIYISLQGTVGNPNVGNPLTDETFWKVVGNKFVPLQEVINSIARVFSVNIAEIQKNGILPWNLTTSYAQGGIVVEEGTTKFYVSIQDNNQGNLLTDTAFWKSLGDIAQLDTLEDIYAPINSPSFTGTPTAPTPSIDDSSTKIATTQLITPPVYFSAWNMVNQIIPAATWTKLNFDSKDTDNRGAFSNSRFTVPVKGVYRISAELIALPGSTSTIASINVYRNGTAFFGSSSLASNNEPQVVNTAYILNLDIEDYLEVYARSSFTGGELVINGGRGTLFCADLIHRT